MVTILLLYASIMQSSSVISIRQSKSSTTVISASIAKHIVLKSVYHIHVCSPPRSRLIYPIVLGPVFQISNSPGPFVSSLAYTHAIYHHIICLHNLVFSFLRMIKQLFNIFNYFMEGREEREREMIERYKEFN